MSKPQRLGEILPEVLEEIEDRCRKRESEMFSSKSKPEPAEKLLVAVAK